MDEKELKGIYQAYTASGLIDPNEVSYERFYSLDPQKAKSLYDLGVRAKIFEDPSPEMGVAFSELFGKPMPVASSPEVQEETMDSPYLEGLKKKQERDAAPFSGEEIGQVRGFRTTTSLESGEVLEGPTPIGFERAEDPSQSEELSTVSSSTRRSKRPSEFNVISARGYTHPDALGVAVDRIASAEREAVYSIDGSDYTDYTLVGDESKRLFDDVNLADGEKTHHRYQYSEQDYPTYTAAMQQAATLVPSVSKEIAAGLEAMALSDEPNQVNEDISEIVEMYKDVDQSFGSGTFVLPDGLIGAPASVLKKQLSRYGLTLSDLNFQTGELPDLFEVVKIMYDQDSRGENRVYEDRGFGMLEAFFAENGGITESRANMTDLGYSGFNQDNNPIFLTDPLESHINSYMANAFNVEFDAALPEVSDQVRKQIEAGNPDFSTTGRNLEMLNDKIVDAFGFNLDLDGDGRVNNMKWSEHMAKSLDIGFNRVGRAFRYANQFFKFQGELANELQREEERRITKNLREQQTQFELNAKESLEAGDYDGFARQVVGTTLESLPQMAPLLAAAPFSGGTSLAIGIGGSALSGTVTGINSYIDSADNPYYRYGAFGSEGALYASIVEGGSDALSSFVFSRVIGGGLRPSGRPLRGFKPYASERFIGSAAGGGFYAKNFLKYTTRIGSGVAQRFGLPLAADMASEVGAEILTYVAHQEAKGEKLDNDEMANIAILAASSSALVSGPLVGGGNIRARAAANSTNIATDRVILDLQRKKADVIKKIKDPNTDQEQRARLEQERAKLNAELAKKRNNLTNSKSGFFTMMQLRHPRVHAALENLAVQASNLQARIESLGPDEDASSLNEELDSIIKQRRKIVDDYANESLDLNVDERSTLMSDDAQQKLAALEQEIASAEESLMVMIENAQFVEGNELSKLNQQIDSKQDLVNQLKQELESKRQSLVDFSERLKDNTATDKQKQDALEELSHLFANDIDTSIPSNLGPNLSVRGVDAEEQRRLAQTLPDHDPDNGIFIVNSSRKAEAGGRFSLTQEQADAINDLISSRGENAQIVLLSKAQADARGLQGKNGHNPNPTRKKGETPFYYVMPDAITENQLAEGAGDLFVASLNRVASEEVLHDFTTPLVKSMGPVKSTKLLQDLFGKLKNESAVGRGIKDRVAAKINSYAKKPGVVSLDRNDNLVLDLSSLEPDQADTLIDEGINEIMNQLIALQREGGDKFSEAFDAPGTNKIIEPIRSFLNEKFPKLFKDEDTVRDLVSVMADLSTGNLSPRFQAKADTDTEISADSNALHPYRLPATDPDQETGPITVFYTHQVGSASYQGARSETGEFTVNDSRGFVRMFYWAKKNKRGWTNFQHVSQKAGAKIGDFTTTPIDTSMLEKAGRSSDKIQMTADNLKQDLDIIYKRTYAASKQDVIRKEDQGVAARYFSKVKAAQKHINDLMTRGKLEENLPVIREKIAQLDNLNKQFVYGSARRNGKRLRFNADQQNFRSSDRITRDLVANLGEDVVKMKLSQLNEDITMMLCGGKKACAASRARTNRQVMQSLISDYFMMEGMDFNNMTNEKKRDVVSDFLATVYANETGIEGYIEEYYGGLDPSKFYDRYATDRENHMSILLPDFKGSKAANKTTATALMNLTAAITSQRNGARVNMVSATNLTSEALGNIDDRIGSRNGKMILEAFDPAVIDLLSRTENLTPDEIETRQALVELIGGLGIAAPQIGNNLGKVNGLLMGVEPDLGNALKAYDQKNPYRPLSSFDVISETGVSERALFNYLNQKSNDGVYLAQEIFGPKIGAMYLNLSGNMDAIVLDSHVTRLIAKTVGDVPTSLNGMANPNNRIKAYLYNTGRQRGLSGAELVDFVKESRNKNFIDGVSKDQYLADNDARYYINGIVDGDILRNVHEVSKQISGVKNHARDTYDKIMFDEVVAPKLRSEKRALYEGIIRDVADKMGIAPAEAMQMMFGDEQVSSKGSYLQVENLTDYAEFASEMQNLRETTSWNQFDVARSKSFFDAAEDAIAVSRIESSKNRDALQTDPYSDTAEGNPNWQDGSSIDRTADARVVKNAEFSTNRASLLAANLFDKMDGPTIDVDGDVDSEAEIDYSGVIAKPDPHRSNVLVDDSGNAIRSAEEATIVGDQHILRGKIEYYAPNDPVLSEGRVSSVDADYARSSDSITRLSAWYSQEMGMDLSEDQAASIYDSLNYDQRKALDESEYVQDILDSVQERNSSRIVRGTIGRVADRFTTVADKIYANPENYIKPTRIAEVRKNLQSMSHADLVKEMTDMALSSVKQNNNPIGILAGAELIDRMVARGQESKIPMILEDMAKAGTTAGRILRFLRELKGVNSNTMYQMILKQAEKNGNTVPKNTKDKLKSMTNVLTNLYQEYTVLEDRAIEFGDNEAELKRKADEIRTVERDLDTLSNSIIESGWGSLFSQTIQGNLITPLSLAVNVGSNLVRMLEGTIIDTVAIPLERLLNLVGVESSYKRPMSLLATANGLANRKGFFGNFYDTLKVVAKGDREQQSEWRYGNGMMPFRSMMAAFSKQDLPVRGGKVRMSQRVKLAYKATVGLSPEIIFRGLTLGDAPFRAYAEQKELFRMAKSRGLKIGSKEFSNFLKNPPREVRDEVSRIGRQLTFQDDTTASEFVETGFGYLQKLIATGTNKTIGNVVNGDELARTLITMFQPYKKTPANILHEVLTYTSPYYAAIRINKNLFIDKDARAASENAAKVMLGSVASGTALLLLKEGLISGPVEDRDKEKNIRFLTGLPPNSVNVSGLKRYLKSGDSNDAKWRPGDEARRYDQMGIVGGVMNAIVISADEAKLRESDYSSLGFLHNGLKEMYGTGTMSATSAMMDRSFLQGINAALGLFTTSQDQFKRNSERFADTFIRAAGATVLPNTTRQFNKATREYYPDLRITRDMDFSERLLTGAQYMIMDRTFNTDDVVVRVNWKGEDITQTPEGSDPIAYNLFDFTKAREAKGDAVGNEVYRLYEETLEWSNVAGTPKYASTAAQTVPNISDRKTLNRLRFLPTNYTFLQDEEFKKEKIYFNTDQMARLMRASGKQRYQEALDLINSSKYNSLTDYEKLEALNELDKDYVSAIELDGRGFKNHTVEFFNIMQEIYEERNER